MLLNYKSAQPKMEILMSSATVEDYLKTIYQLSQARGDNAPITTSEIAERLALASATVTSMIQRLAQPELELLQYTPYQGVRLTAQGEKIALRVIRRHRLLELYLATRLGLRWDQVHEEAERLEHHISSTLEERIAAALGDPQVDPHGHPIPSAAGELIQRASTSLARFALGEDGVIVSVNDDDPEFLRYLAARGMYPGVPLVVTEREPFGGPLHVRVGPAHDQQEFTLGVSAAERIQISANPAPTNTDTAAIGDTPQQHN
jgi:DtxR family Mn-dependent transcriptional regulator